jgi:hypothetical protein
METTQTGIRFPNDLLDKIKKIADHDMRTVTNTVIIGMRKFVEDWERSNSPTMTEMPSRKKK